MNEATRETTRAIWHFLGSDIGLERLELRNKGETYLVSPDLSNILY
jgi:hypothetical protein